MDEAQRKEELLELLADMKHDLGKYLVMPVAMLPAHAPEVELRDGLRRALHCTRGSGSASRSARQLWSAFVAEGGDGLRAAAGFAALESAVQAAIAWEQRLEDSCPLDREALLSDLRAVGETIAEMICATRGTN